MIFTSDDIQTRLKEQPFVPARLVTTTGQTYDLYHPEMVVVARRFLFVGLPSAENPIQADQVTRLAYVHLTESRDLPQPIATTSNGQP